MNLLLFLLSLSISNGIIQNCSPNHLSNFITQNNLNLAINCESEEICFFFCPIANHVLSHFRFATRVDLKCDGGQWNYIELVKQGELHIREKPQDLNHKTASFFNCTERPKKQIFCNLDQIDGQILDIEGHSAVPADIGKFFLKCLGKPEIEPLYVLCGRNGVLLYDDWTLTDPPLTAETYEKHCKAKCKAELFVETERRGEIDIQGVKDDMKEGDVMTMGCKGMDLMENGLNIRCKNEEWESIEIEGEVEMLKEKMSKLCQKCKTDEIIKYPFKNCRMDYNNEKFELSCEVTCLHSNLHHVANCSSFDNGWRIGTHLLDEGMSRLCTKTTSNPTKTKDGAIPPPSNLCTIDDAISSIPGSSAYCLPLDSNTASPTVPAPQCFLNCPSSQTIPITCNNGNWHSVDESSLSSPGSPLSLSHCLPLPLTNKTATQSKPSPQPQIPKQSIKCERKQPQNLSIKPQRKILNQCANSQNESALKILGERIERIESALLKILRDNKNWQIIYETLKKSCNQSKSPEIDCTANRSLRPLESPETPPKNSRWPPGITVKGIILHVVLIAQLL